MAGEWQEVVLEQLAAPVRNALVGGPFGSDLVSSDYVESGVPVIRGENLSSRWVAGEFVFVSEQKAKLLSANTAGPLDIVFTQRGANHYRQVAVVPAEPHRRFVISQSQMKLTVDRGRVDPLFVYYLFRAPQQQEYLRRNAIATGVPHTNLSILRDVPLQLPPLTEQRAITQILGTLDDKIELNRRMSETLEAMARALFKSWFVDFDPVRAKMEGRDPGLPEHLADIFPARLVDSELGEIPEGWEVGDVDSLCESISSGGTPARMNTAYWDGGSIPWFKTGELLDGPLLDSEEHITEAALANSSCKLWPARTILFALYASPTVGRLGVLTVPGTSNQAAAGLIVKASYGVPFLMRTLIQARTELQSIAVGAAQQNINQRVLKSRRIIVPPSELAATYSRVISPFDAQKVTIARESHSLAALRDTLLPKLISGELRVADFEAFSSRVV